MMTTDLDSLFQVSVISGSSGVFEVVGTTPTSIVSGNDFEYKAVYLGSGTVKLSEVMIKWSV